MNLKATKKYYLLLIDIKKSTAISAASRKAIFDQIESHLKVLNHSLKPTPALKLSVSYGDEIAGLFESPQQFYAIVERLREALYPKARLRFVATYGKIGVISEDIRKVGGEIFKHADKRMQQLKKQDGFCAWSLRNAKRNAILNSLTEMCNHILERMTPYQRKVWQLIEQGKTQKAISEQLKKYPQSVSHAVKRGGADKVLKAGQVINQILENA